MYILYVIVQNMLLRAGLVSTAEPRDSSKQQVFGQVGDGASSDLCQKAKAFAGKMEHSAAAGKQRLTYIYIYMYIYMSEVLD